MEIASLNQVVASSACGNLQNHIYTQIRNGTLRPGEKLHTARIAKEFKISEGTVHQSLRMLATKGMLVRKRHVGTFVEENIKSPVAESKERTSRIAVLMPDIKQAEFLILAQAVQTVAADNQLLTNVIGAEHDIARYSQFIRKQIEQGVDGLIIVPPLYGTIPVEVLIELYNSGIPVVCCFRPIRGFGWPHVRVDGSYNMQIAATHLCHIGRKHIVFLAEDSMRSHYGLVKEHAFLATIHEFGFSTKKGSCLALSTFDPRMAQETWLLKSINQIKDWLNENPEVDGICCGNDMTAWAVMLALEKMGKKVPEDIAVVGNGDLLSFYGFAQNNLSTIDMSYSEIGSTLLRLLAQIRNGEQIEFDAEVEVKGKLIMRYSTVGNKSKEFEKG